MTTQADTDLAAIRAVIHDVAAGVTSHVMVREGDRWAIAARQFTRVAG